MSKKDDFQDATDAYNRKDYKEAVKWYRLAAEQGDASAQYNLGVEWLLVKFLTGNFFVDFFQMEIFRKSLYIASI